MSDMPFAVAATAAPAGIAWSNLLLLLLLGLFVLVVLVVVVVLLSHPKTRVATLALLGVVGVIPVLLLSFMFLGRAYTEVPRPVAVQAHAAPPAKRPLNALTLTLSQEERGPDSTPSQGKREPDNAKPRPAWVDEPPKLVGDVYQMSVAIGPYTTRAECDAKLPEALQEALDHYVNIFLGDQAVDDIRLPAEYLRQQLVKAQWEEVRQLRVGPMTWLHVQLQFDRKMKDRILDEHRQAIIGLRLHAAATWSAIALALLTVAFGYLKTDLATGGVYRGRLRLAAVVAILGLVGVAVVIVL